MTSRKINNYLTSVLIGLLGFSAYAQEVVTDYDGNVYQTIVVGEQTWFQENLKCLHDDQGNDIQGVVAYDDNESNADIYGRLYSWTSAMNGETIEGGQGICPDGWHIPSHAEWSILERFLGGAAVAGGKLKEAGSEHWVNPNTGADNSSGFCALPAGEYDSHYTPNTFQLLNEYAVFWTSTSSSLSMATERYLSYDNAASTPYNWYKSMKYSIRPIKDAVSSSLHEDHFETPESAYLFPGSPNPFNPTIQISYHLQDPVRVNIVITDLRGRTLKSLVGGRKEPGNYTLTWNGLDGRGKPVSSGVYLVMMQSNKRVQVQKISLIR